MYGADAGNYILKSHIHCPQATACWVGEIRLLHLASEPKLIHLLNKKAFMESNNKYSEIENPRPIVSEPAMVYGIRRENSDKLDYSLRNELRSAITGEELITRLRPRIKTLFE